MLTLEVLIQDQNNEYILRKEITCTEYFNYLNMLDYCHFKKSSLLKFSDSCS